MCAQDNRHRTAVSAGPLVLLVTDAVHIRWDPGGVPAVGSQHCGQRRFGLDDQTDRTGNKHLLQHAGFVIYVVASVARFIVS